MNRDVNQIPTIELKAIAYDLTKQGQFIQSQLSLVEQELINRAQQENEAAKVALAQMSSSMF